MRSWGYAGIAVGVLGGVIFSPAAVRAQDSSTSASNDLSGYWELSVDSRQVPPAKLLPAVTKAAIAKHHRNDAHAVRWCNWLGVPFVMDSGRPLDIEVGGREIIMISQVEAEPRHIYLDRSTHIDKDDFDLSTGGDSIAHWEGDTLVIDTVGFSPDRGITSIPGGGYRTESSHLVERVHLLENGSVLSVVSTWTDPTVYRVPHRYEYRYYRLPATYEAPPMDGCDPFDEERAKFLDSGSASAGQ